MPKKPTPAIVRLLDRVEIMGPMAYWIYPTTLTKEATA